MMQSMYISSMPSSDDGGRVREMVFGEEGQIIVLVQFKFRGVEYVEFVRVVRHFGAVDRGF